MSIANGCCKATMADWKQSKIARKNKASRTPGKAKGERCQADAMDKFFCRRNRSYKHREYGAWCEKVNRMNGIKGR